jgi:GT2 family glycosyltransferase
MNSMEISDFFNAYYFEHDCGLPYRRDDHWLNFFGRIATHILRGIQPSTVLDAGCAMGFLVEKLRQEKIEAWGIDISEYAIQNVHPQVKPYCWLGSVVDPFPQKYDLIVSIEVLEHMRKLEAEAAIINFCQHTDDILFSSTPTDYAEASHINLQQPEYWSELFAHEGFFRDIDFDASFITPWAVRYRRKSEPVPRLVRDYDRKFWLLWKENTDLRNASLDFNSQLMEGEKLLAEGDKKIQDYIRTIEEKNEELEKLKGENYALIISLHSRKDTINKIAKRISEIENNNQALNDKVNKIENTLQENEQLIDILKNQVERKDEENKELMSTVTELGNAGQELRNHLEKVTKEYTGILVSRSWRFMQQIHRLRYFFIPIQSRRERWMHLVFRGIGTLKDHGFIEGFKRVILKLKTKEPIQVSGQEEIDEYHIWIVENEPKETELEYQKTESKNFKYRPLISIITPVYNPPHTVLKEMFDSVLSQTYENWELCVVDGASNIKEVKITLKQYDERDSRIRIRFLNENKGISGNSNLALDMAKGEFIALLDHDDLLAPHMLFEVVTRLNEKPKTDLVYFDEDKVTEDSHIRHSPFFKPDWSPDLLLSINYLTHPVIRRSLIDSVGTFTPEMDGTQDWDLVFRCMEKSDRIEHIPKILYHWRQIQGSAATLLDAKSWVFDRQLQCVNNHLFRMGIKNAEVSFASPGYLKVEWPSSGKKVSIIIPTKDKFEYLKKSVESILNNTTYTNFEVILIDNGSSDQNVLDYYQNLSSDKRLKIVENPGDFNFSAANNLGGKHATGEYFLFLNNDIEVLEPDWLEEMVRWADREEIGVVGGKLLYPDGTIQHAGVVIGMEGHASHVFWGAQEKQSGPFGSVDWYRNFMAVTGACMMIRRKVFEEVGGFDERYLLVFSDIEICMRVVERGYRVIYNPFVRLRHYEGKSRGNHMPSQDIQLGFDHFIELVEKGDPYYNPNLSYSSRMPMIADLNEEGRIERLQRLRQLSRK